MKKISILNLSFLLLPTAYCLRPKAAYAAITNPALEGSLGDPSTASTGETVFGYLINLWNIVISLGALMLLLYLIWGAVDWITSGGDSGKVASARNKMVQAVIGMIILAFSFMIVGFINYLFFDGEFDLLNLSLPTPA